MLTYFSKLRSGDLSQCIPTIFLVSSVTFFTTVGARRATFWRGRVFWGSHFFIARVASKYTGTL